MIAEIKKLKEEKKTKRRENEKILKDKDLLEEEVRKKQEETAELENTYKELLLLSQQLKVIKRNELPSNTEENGMETSPKNGRAASDAAISLVSNEMEMMMDVPDDFDENEFLAENDDQEESDNEFRDGRVDTLESSRKGSMASEIAPSKTTPRGKDVKK